MTRRLAPIALLAVLAASGCAGEGGASEPGRAALGAAPTSLSVQVPARKAGEPAMLVLSDLSTNAQPGVLYRVQLGGKSGPTLGYVNFFNVATGGPASFSFEAGAALDRLPAGRPVEIVITPEGAPDPAARPVVGKVSLSVNAGGK